MHANIQYTHNITNRLPPPTLYNPTPPKSPSHKTHNIHHQLYSPTERQKNSLSDKQIQYRYIFLKDLLKIIIKLDCFAYYLKNTKRNICKRGNAKANILKTCRCRLKKDWQIQCELHLTRNHNRDFKVIGTLSRWNRYI